MQIILSLFICLFTLWCDIIPSFYLLGFFFSDVSVFRQHLLVHHLHSHSTPLLAVPGGTPKKDLAHSTASTLVYLAKVIVDTWIGYLYGKLGNNRGTSRNRHYHLVSSKRAVGKWKSGEGKKIFMRAREKWVASRPRALESGSVSVLLFLVNQEYKCLLIWPLFSINRYNVMTRFKHYNLSNSV